jgi:serine protease Do
MFSDQRSARKQLIRATWPVGLVIILLLGVGAITWLVRPLQSRAEAGAPPEVATLEAVQAGFNWMAESVKPAVVFIEVEQKSKGEGVAQEGPKMELPDPLRDFFGREFPFPRQSVPQVPSMGQGSGVVVDPAGYILTNNHVVGSAAKVTVHLADGQSYPAEVTGTDALSDLAVIKIEPKGRLAAAKLGNAETCKAGSWAMAIGFPFGGQRFGGRFDEALRYEPTVTVGVISATNRQLESDIPGRPFRNLIQTDAPINPGSSGGPLVNIRAEVIGINQAIFTSGPVGGNIGVGFAIPIDESNKAIIESLKGGEPIVRGQLGVLVSPLTPTLKSVYGAEQGVFVEEVQSDTPASRGGLKAEDVILSYNGKPVSSVDQFVTAVQNTKPGKTAEIQVLRDGKRQGLKVTVEALSLEQAKKEATKAEGGKLGMTVESVPADRSAEIGIAGGVVVRSLNPMGAAARAGVQPGDIINKINRRQITDIASYRSAEEALQKGDPVAIRIRRGDRMFTAQIEGLEE